MKFTIQIESKSSADINAIATLADLLLNAHISPDDISVDPVSNAIDGLLSALGTYIESWAAREYPDDTAEMVRFIDARVRDIHRALDESQRAKELTNG